MPKIFDRFGHALARRLALLAPVGKRGDGDALGVDFEVPAQRLAAFAAAEAVGAQREQAAGHPRVDLLGHGPHVVRAAMNGPFVACERLLDVAAAAARVGCSMFQRSHSCASRRSSV